jgi:hypothetical protein
MQKRLRKKLKIYPALGIAGKDQGFFTINTEIPATTYRKHTYLVAFRK